ncbi:hypothetical protein LINPERPRIM_LOCUS22880 [Linum perenne]
MGYEKVIFETDNLGVTSVVHRQKGTDVTEFGVINKLCRDVLVSKPFFEVNLG